VRLIGTTRGVATGEVADVLLMTDLLQGSGVPFRECGVMSRPGSSPVPKTGRLTVARPRWIPTSFSNITESTSDYGPVRSSSMPSSRVDGPKEALSERREVCLTDSVASTG
jgi:hypothetical protein